jgi:hypothetical protein
MKLPLSLLALALGLASCASEPVSKDEAEANRRWFWANFHDQPLTDALNRN